MRSPAGKNERLANEIEKLRRKVALLEGLETQCGKIEKNLKSERDKAREYLDVAGVILLVIGADQKVSLINGKGCQILGYREDEIVGKNWFDHFIPAEDRDTVKGVFLKLMSGEIVPIENFENSILTRDGRKRVIAWHNHVLTDEEGSISGTLSSGEDITDRKLAEEALQESERKYRNLVDNALVGIYKTSLSGDILYVNESLARMMEFDSSKELLSGQVFSRYKNPEDRKALIDMLRQKGKVDNLELETVTKSGRTKHVLLNATLDAGFISGMVLDISDRKRAEKKLEEAVAELKRSNAELDHFAHVASHDLKEPLLTIMSYLKLLERRYKGKLETETDQFISDAIKNAMRMQTMISELLEFSRVGRADKSFERTDSNAVLTNSLANLRNAIDQSNASVTHDPLPEVMADQVQLIQLFQNLISNALKFCGASPPRIHISAVKRDKEWVFSVRDNGIGIPEEHLGDVFELFQRLHKDKYPGTGIGLSTCKKIVERHGGRIWVESEAGKGSTFYFTLPAGNNEFT
jgi:PAS domain S-box-containing protein